MSKIGVVIKDYIFPVVVALGLSEFFFRLYLKKREEKIQHDKIVFQNLNTIITEAELTEYFNDLSGYSLMRYEALKKISSLINSLTLIDYRYSYYYTEKKKKHFYSDILKLKRFTAQHFFKVNGLSDDMELYPAIKDDEGKVRFLEDKTKELDVLVCNARKSFKSYRQRVLNKYSL